MTELLFLLLLLGSLIIIYLIKQPQLSASRRKSIRYQEFPKQWESLLLTHWPLYTRLPDLLKQSLNEKIRLFMAEKTFEPCNGFPISESHKVLIAAQACLLIVNKPFSIGHLR